MARPQARRRPIVQASVVADAERRREQADAHRENDHHRVMHLMDPDRLGDREHERGRRARWPAVPSSTEPRMRKATIDTAMNVDAIRRAGPSSAWRALWAKPAWVIAHAIPGPCR